MTQRSAFQLQILEKLGAPLLKAVSEVSAHQPDGGQRQEAELVAALLNKTVQVSIQLSGSVDIKDADGDAVRLALAAMAGPLIAGQYRATGKVPGEGDLKRMVRSLEAVLTFSDNFVPAADNTMRLENISPGAAPADEAQVNIQYVSALVPVVNAVASFPFGRAENKLVQEVAGRLVARSVQLGKALLGSGADDKALKRAELNILKALSDIYVECHQAETKRLMDMDDAARARAAEQAGGVLPMDPVWEAFDRRVGMMEVLGKAAGPDGDPAQSTPAQQAPSPFAAAPASPSQMQKPEIAQPPAQQPVPQDRQTGGSPLSMFAKKPAAPGAPPPVQEATPPQEAEEQAGAAFSPFAPQDSFAPAVDSGGGEDTSYNPMSFFKPRDGGDAGDGQGDH